MSQSPRHRVAGRGQTVNLRCDPISGHVSLYWYRQTLGQGPEFLTYFQNDQGIDKSGMPKNRFSAERPESTYSYLKIQPVEPGDSAVYLCASSPTTVRHSHLLPVHKPHPSLSLQLPEPLNRLFFAFHSPICGASGKEFLHNAEDPGSSPGSVRSPGEGNGYLLQYSCLESFLDRGV